MTKYLVTLQAELTTYFKYEEIIKADNEDEAMKNAQNDFAFDPSIYERCTDEPKITFLEASHI